MALSFELVDGAGLSADASRLLEEAWNPPAVHYTPNYLTWQLSFPSPSGLPCAAAFDGSKLVGFAGATARRLRHGAGDIYAAIVSFVAVHPDWRGQGAATGMYRILVQALAEREIPVITYAMPATAGERALLKAYPAAGFRIQPLGTYSNYAFARGGDGTDEQWRGYFSEDAAVLSSLAEELADEDTTGLWSGPTQPQLEHYFTDPRPRKLILVEHASTGHRGGGFVLRSELRTPDGVVTVTTLDSVWLQSAAITALPCLLRLAAAAWPHSGTAPPVVMCPNLSGFDPSALRSIGLRKTGGQFCGYFCSTGRQSCPGAERTNLEIV